MSGRRFSGLVTRDFAPDDRQRAREAAPSAELQFTDDIRAIEPEELARFDLIAGQVDACTLAAASRLDWIHSWTAGVDACLYPELIEGPVTLTSSAGNGAIPLAEHALLLMLLLDSDVRRWLRAQEEHAWDSFPHSELNGKTVGIVGLGNSGSDLAIKAAAFHMRVLGMRRNPDRSVSGVERIYATGELHELLPQCDFVVVTAPLTSETRGLFDAAAFRSMKRSAYFICISRGGIADDDALLGALREGQIAGAGIDAHGVEPLPTDSPFWSLPNVILTPHNGATTPPARRRGMDIFLENLHRYSTGELLLNVVDKGAGY